MRKANKELGRGKKSGRWDRTHRCSRTEVKEKLWREGARREKTEVSSRCVSTFAYLSCTYPETPDNGDLAQSSPNQLIKLQHQARLSQFPVSEFHTLWGELMLQRQ